MVAQLAPADLVRRMFEARAQSDADGVIATLAPEVEIVALDGATYRGHDEIRDYF
ncbi:MAG: hypothetical protein QOG68_1098, partial [Solirubrobacteraceae bacterium]|nr:hypothetical protein [Solirubrobacteraceae bacterium]